MTETLDDTPSSSPIFPIKIQCNESLPNINCTHGALFKSSKPDPKSTSFLYKGPMMNLSTSTEGMYGEISENCIKSIADQMKEYGLDENSVVLDLGSGRGAPSIIFAHQYEIFSSIGIEKCEQAFINCMTNLKILIDREKDQFKINGLSTKMCYPYRGLAFANEDLSSFADFEGATHLYSFDAAMEGQLINNIAYQFIVTSTAWFFASFHHDLISTFGLKGCQIVKKIPVNMTGSGEGRTVYIYVKDNWEKIKMQAKIELRENIMKDSFEGGIFHPAEKIYLSKWMQPLKVADLVCLSKAPLYYQDLWLNSFFDKYSLGILTRSQKEKLWGAQISEYKRHTSKCDKLLEEIAKSKTHHNLISSRKRLALLQKQRLDNSIELHFRTLENNSNCATDYKKQTKPLTSKTRNDSIIFKNQSHLPKKLGKKQISTKPITITSQSIVFDANVKKLIKMKKKS